MLANAVSKFDYNHAYKSAVLSNLPSKNSAKRNFNIRKSKNITKIKNPY